MMVCAGITCVSAGKDGFKDAQSCVLICITFCPNELQENEIGYA